MNDWEKSILTMIFAKATDYEAKHGRKPKTIRVDDYTYMMLLRVRADAVRVVGGLREVTVTVFGFNVEPFENGIVISAE